MPGVLPIDDERLLAHLAEGEEPRVFVRQHPMALLRPALRALGASSLWLWLAASVPPGRFLDGLLLLTLALWLHLGWSELERRFNFIAVTDKRIFRTEGMLSRRYPAMRINKVTDVTLVRPVAGLVLGYSTVVIESAGQDQALRELRYIPFPEASDRLWAELFGSRPKARRERRRLSLSGLRRRRGDSGGWDGTDGPDDGPDGRGPGGPEGGDGAGPDGPGEPFADDGGESPWEVDRFTSGELWEEPVDLPSAVREGDPRRSPRNRAGRPLADEDDPDVPAAGDWRAHPRTGGSRRPPAGETLYQSPDLRPRTRRDADTGPIPLVTRRRER